MGDNLGSPLTKKPTGGHDSTELPKRPPGYTVRITVHRAQNLPIADISSLSADPYVVLTLETDIPPRHPEDPKLTCRTPTIRRDVNPVWNTDWTVANIPASGFKLVFRLFDEDLDHDDRLGSVHLHVDRVYEGWQGIKEQPFQVRKRAGSKRAYLVRSVAAACSREKELNATLYVSVQCLGRTDDQEGGRVYTVGPNRWTKHFSPLIGRLVGTKTEQTHDAQGDSSVLTYNFQAIQLQLTGPVPASLYHRYVEFKPFIGHVFTSNNISGFVLNRALHHQHRRIYSYDRATIYGICDSPSAITEQFLDFVTYADGGRIFTYVITLDAEWRFTETGKEFGIDMLSKHSMHSDVAIYIAFSGEFFVRRRKGHHRSMSRQSTRASLSADDKDPDHYELIIDNDSGTYRPDSSLLQVLQEFLARNLPGLRVKAMDSQSEEQQNLKAEQRAKKHATGKKIAYVQRSPSSSSVSSSDMEDLDERAATLFPPETKPRE